MTDNLEIPEITPTDNTPVGEFDKELYKKWFKAGGNAGFLSITPFMRDGEFVGRFIVDVGSINPNNNQVQSSTKCYVDAVQFLVYLRAVNEGRGDLFPRRNGTHSNESFIAYGGSAGANPVARIFKIEYWGATRDNPGTPGAWAWKCGHFKGNVTGTGAITPIMTESLSSDMIKVSRLEMAEIATRVELAMIGFASANSRWYE